MIKVCHISTVHNVFDGRIFHKECKSLSEAGYEVYLIATNDKEEIIDGVHIIPLPEKKERFYRFFVKDWVAFFKAIRLNARVYHFHDPELIFIGLLLKVFGKKVIYDVHEDVPKQILVKNWLKPYFIRMVISVLFGFIEYISSLCFDRIVTATDDIAKKFPVQKTIVLKNFPILKVIDEAEPLEKNEEKFVLIYAGGLTRIRGIKEIIQAMEFVGEEAELLLLGEWESEKFEKECQSLEGWRYTKYIGFKKLKEVYQYMKASDVGVHLDHPVANYVTGLSTKVFEYMACGLPVVVSNFPYWKKLFGKYALFANPKDPKDIANKIKIFMENKELREQMGKAGMIDTRDIYSWEKESKKLVKLYEKLLK